LTDIYKEIFNVLNNNWSASVDKPLIGIVTDYRWLDVANKEYVLIGNVIQDYSFLGLGAKDYRNDVQISLLIKTGKSRERGIEILEEVLRILKTKEYWSPFINVLVGNISDISSAERKIYSFTIIVRATVLETVQ